jgi:hypothetical protein
MQSLCFWDPDSLLTGAEGQAGFTYTNSRRIWPDEKTFRRAIAGELSSAEILRLAPRQFIDIAVKGVAA